MSRKITNLKPQLELCTTTDTQSMAEPSADLIAWLASVNEALVVHAKVFASEGYENFGFLRNLKEDERDDILEALDAAGIKKVRVDLGV